MRIQVPPPAWLRAICLAAFIAALIQIFFFDPPRALVALTLWDKIKHAIAYGGVAILLWVAIGYHSSFANWLAITAIGGLDEFHQLFVPSRTSDALDVVADAVGAALAVLVLHRLKKNEPTEGSRRALWTEQ